ncbi:Major facilitator superfamily domain-containing protein [Madurella fahalii]|uniref:Major facilitator superfamily domain-containing protein n=1 Tax=Madurella fahalii TaxID=1157608 RepID=A0ABQ0G0M2_9PEZI
MIARQPRTDSRTNTHKDPSVPRQVYIHPGGDHELLDRELTKETRAGAEPGTGDLEAAYGNAPASRPNGSTPSSRIDTGWRPWKVVIGCFFLTVPIYGLLSSIGLFQTYWHEHMLHDHSESEISWIISIFGFLDCLFASPAGILFDRYGSAWLLPVGSVAYIAAFVGLVFSSTYGELMGCMTVAGVAAAIPSTIAFSVVSQWFRDRAGIATGVVTLGAALGGIFFSLVLQALFANLEWKAASLVLTAMLASFLLAGNVLVETNTVHHTAHEGGRPEGPRLSGMLRSPKFWLVGYAIFAYELVLFIQWGSIPSYAVSTNAGDVQFYLMMSYNIGAVVGRTVPPYLSDRKLGPINTITIMNIFTLLVVLVIWLPFGASSTPALFFTVVLMGIGTGSFVPLGASCVNTLCTPQAMGTWLGSAYSIASFATLIGNPSSAAILARYKSNGMVGFLAAILFSGLISVAALRWLCHGRRWIFKGRV